MVKFIEGENRRQEPETNNRLKSLINSVKKGYNNIMGDRNEAE